MEHPEFHRRAIPVHSQKRSVDVAGGHGLVDHERAGTEPANCSEMEVGYRSGDSLVHLGRRRLAMHRTIRVTDVVPDDILGIGGKDPRDVVAVLGGEVAVNDVHRRHLPFGSTSEPYCSVSDAVVPSLGAGSLVAGPTPLERFGSPGAAHGGGPLTVSGARRTDLGQHGSMPHDRKFRFAAQLSKAPDGTAKSWAEQARKAEDLGYSTLHWPDHSGDPRAPGPALAAVAAATTTLRMGSLVFCNDYRHPFVLAKEAATLDLLSDGRLELSLGAGWMRTDYDEAGLTYDEPAVRVDRFEEAVTVINGLLRTDGPFDFHGKYYEVRGHALTPRPVQQPGPPLIIGGGGKRVLSFAAQHADIVSINANLREGTGGVETAADLTPDRTRQKVAWVREAAGYRFDDLELNALIGFAIVTDDAPGLAAQMAPAFGIDPADALHVPVALAGTLDEMAEELRWRREEYGISYWSIESDAWETLAPVVSSLAGQ